MEFYAVPNTVLAQYPTKRVNRTQSQDGKLESGIITSYLLQPARKLGGPSPEAMVYIIEEAVWFRSTA